jgi:2-methylisocitrate lyase-like PEP mutase family enzyme
MKHILTKRKSWKEVLSEATLPLQLPVAHDSLSARLIELAGFKAYQVGGFALAAAMHAVPDVDLEKFGEKRAAIENIINSSPLPVLVDVDDGYGDAKNVTRTIHEYARIGASAVFMEDQQAPKKCGHMGGKHVIPTEAMQNKVRAAAAARQNTDLFILARTDAIAVEGLNKAIDRGKAYLDAGADGIYLEGPTTVDELEKIGKTFNGVPLATSILEGGGKTPWVSPQQMREMGFSMILYPTTVLFQVAYTIQQALKNLQDANQMPALSSLTMKQFLNVVDLPFWAEIEQKFEPSQG